MVHPLTDAYNAGYQEAIEKACEWIEEYITESGLLDEWCRWSKYDFVKSMEE